MNLNAFLLFKRDDFLQCFVTLVLARWCPKLGAVYSASKTKEYLLKNNTIDSRRSF